MFKYVLQLMIGFLVFMFSTIIAWYEGSAIIENSFDWKYSTPFSKLLNIEITNGHDISQLDYFVYAAKFQPLFPSIMMFSALYMLVVLIVLLQRFKQKVAIIVSAILGLLLVGICGLLVKAQVIGGPVLFRISLLGACSFLAIALIIWYQRHKQKTHVSIVK